MEQMEDGGDNLPFSSCAGFDNFEPHCMMLARGLMEPWNGVLAVNYRGRRFNDVGNRTWEEIRARVDELVAQLHENGDEGNGGGPPISWYQAHFVQTDHKLHYYDKPGLKIYEVDHRTKELQKDIEEGTRTLDDMDLRERLLVARAVWLEKTFQEFLEIERVILEKRLEREKLKKSYMYFTSFSIILALVELSMMGHRFCLSRRR